MEVVSWLMLVLLSSTIAYLVDVDGVCVRGDLVSKEMACSCSSCGFESVVPML